MPNQSPAQEQVAAELAKLPGYLINTLRERWRALFRSEPPPAFGPDLLRRSIAQKLQEDAYRELSPTVQRELNRIIALLEKSPTNRIELPRRIMVGAVLVRDWKGTTHRVTVVENGFSYHDHTYTSLSEIAREITGTRWNGPRFFGLRTPEESQKKSDNTPRPKRGRPSKSAATEPSVTNEARHGF